MRLRSSSLSIVALVVLALLAAGLSLAALTRGSSVSATPIRSTTAGSEASSAPTTASPSDSESGSSPSPVPTASPTETSGAAHAGLKAVVIGDTYSTQGDEDAWVEAATKNLQWELTNLASPGRGYLAKPRECSFEPCGTFAQSIERIAEDSPDVVITFGGTADGDQDLRGAAATYFKDLRAALPDAKLVAIAPITTDDEWPYYLTMHASSIRAAVEAVDGTFINSSRIGLGDGEQLSEESQQELADLVVAALRNE